MSSASSTSAPPPYPINTPTLSASALGQSTTFPLSSPARRAVSGAMEKEQNGSQGFHDSEKGESLVSRRGLHTFMPDIEEAV